MIVLLFGVCCVGRRCSLPASECFTLFSEARSREGGGRVDLRERAWIYRTGCGDGSRSSAV